MAIEVRNPRNEDEKRAGMRAAGVAFAETVREDDFERELTSLPLERTLVAFDEERAVGFAAAYAFELTVPGARLPCSGVTWVGVLPSHRRRGILREFMARQFADAREWGEPLAVLYASESAIYGRFGYGSAAPSARIDADCARFAYRDDPGSSATVRLVDVDEAYRLIAPVYERIRVQRAGMMARSEHWWRAHRLADPEHWREGASEKYFAVLELDGAAEGYAVYRVKHDWEAEAPKGEVRVIEALATSTEAWRDLWRFLVSIDLTARVRARKTDPTMQLFFMVVDPRSLGLSFGDGLWLRLVDVDAALRARSYAPGEPVVLAVGDDMCPWNAGRYRAGEGAGRTDGEADLAIDVADLASVYLGAFSFERLAAAGRVRELRAGALARASALFRTALPPFCVEDF